MTNKKIVVLEDGPYKALEINRIENALGDVLSTKNEVWLCRCGGSNNKPFCDGTHTSNGFSGETLEDGSRNHTIEYVGEKITIYDNRDICAKRGYCTRELPKVFTKEELWIKPNEEAIDKIIDICNRCPSGALSYKLNDQNEESIETTEALLKLSEKRFGAHGPYDIKGVAEITGQIKRQPELNSKMTLCRCGASTNKPYCSGEHYKIKFQDDKNE